METLFWKFGNKRLAKPILKCRNDLHDVRNELKNAGTILMAGNFNSINRKETLFCRSDLQNAGTRSRMAGRIKNAGMKINVAV
jgi:hypothetical protein